MVIGGPWVRPRVDGFFLVGDWSALGVSMGLCRMFVDLLAVLEIALGPIGWRGVLGMALQDNGILHLMAFF